MLWVTIGLLVTHASSIVSVWWLDFSWVQKCCMVGVIVFCSRFCVWVRLNVVWSTRAVICGVNSFSVFGVMGLLWVIGFSGLLGIVFMRIVDVQLLNVRNGIVKILLVFGMIEYMMFLGFE